MNLPRKFQTCVVLLVSAIFVPTAWPQGRINNGNALDANNRIGSGGYNAGGNQNRGPYVGYTATDVINGNVTGAKTFRGFVPYRDTGAFTVPPAGNQGDRSISES